jgi:hypothetical protein
MLRNVDMFVARGSWAELLKERFKIMQTHTKRLPRRSAALLAGFAAAGVALGWRAAPRLDGLGHPTS